MSEATSEGPEVLHLVRVTIEAVSPLSLGSGDVVSVQRERRGDNGIETKTGNVVALARDANGLPVIPGATLQGVLRHLYASEYRERDAQELFGFAEGTGGDAGRLFVGFGAIHDEDDKALIGLVTDAARIKDDLVLTLLRGDEPLLRDHVALNGRHVADGRKKFERRAVPVGTRFSVEFALWGKAAEATADKALLQRIADLFGHPAMRLGGAGRQGYGRVVPRRASYACPGLDNPIALRRLRDQVPSVALSENILSNSTIFEHGITMTLALRPINPWRVGGGQGVYLNQGTHGVRRDNGNFETVANADLRTEDHNALDVATILREPAIVWANGKATPRRARGDSAFDGRLPGSVAFGVPGSAIKGPLVHRTLFHWNCHRTDIDGMIDVDAWLKKKDDERDADLKMRTNRPEELGTLFGAAKEREHGTGRAGRAYVDDGAVTGVRAVQALDHVVIDRFTGGVIPTLLYVEEVLDGGSVEVKITILPPPPGVSDGGDWRPDVRDAFLLALRDLCRARLAIGAKSHGFCAGDITAWGGANAHRPVWEAAWKKLAEASPGKAAA